MKVFNVFPSRPGEPALVSAAARGLGSRRRGRGGRRAAGAAAGPVLQRYPAPGSQAGARRWALGLGPPRPRSTPLGPAGPRAAWSAPQADLREDVVDADDAVRAGRAAVVHDGGVALHPHPAAVLGQEAVVFGGHLPFHQHCGNKAGRALARVRPPFGSALGRGCTTTTTIPRAPVGITWGSGVGRGSRDPQAPPNQR